MKEEPESPWIDISVPLRDGMAHWPADPPITIRRVKSIDRGDSANLSEISMGAHSATHVDAPCHFIKEGSGVDRISMDIMIGGGIRNENEVRDETVFSPDRRQSY
jgi:arylformamidase